MGCDPTTIALALAAAGSTGGFLGMRGGEAREKARQREGQK